MSNRELIEALRNTPKEFIKSEYYGRIGILMNDAADALSACSVIEADLRDIIAEMLDAQGHMCSGLHDIEELYQVNEERASEIRAAAKFLSKPITGDE